MLQDSSQISSCLGERRKRLETANSGFVFSSGSVGVPTAQSLSINPHTVLCVTAQSSAVPTEPPLPHGAGTLPSLGTPSCAHPHYFWASQDAGVWAEAIGRAAGPPWTTHGPQRRMERAAQQSPARHGEQFAVSHDVPSPLACAGWCQSPHSPPATPQSRRARRGWIVWNKPSILLLFSFPG